MISFIKATSRSGSPLPIFISSIERATRPQHNADNAAGLYCISFHTKKNEIILTPHKYTVDETDVEFQLKSFRTRRLYRI